jgi:hypothetical protein
VFDWGDKDRFKFNARIDTYSNTTEINQGENRIVKTDFGLTLQGYLVPDSINKELVKRPQKSFSKATVVFNSEIVVGPSGQPTTRRKERKTINIEQIGLGIGYQIVGQSTEIG